MDAEDCRGVASGVEFAPARRARKAKGDGPKPWKRATSPLINLKIHFRRTKCVARKAIPTQLARVPNNLTDTLAQ